MSERVSCLPHEKAMNKVSFVPISHLHKYIQQKEEGRRGWKRMRARATDRGNKLGALVLSEVQHVSSMYALTKD